MVLVLALASVGIAFQNEPEGFYGLKWGDPIGEDMVYAYEYGNIATYTRSSDEMQLGQIALDDVAYVFYKGRFMMGQIEFSGKDKYRYLRKIFIMTYGEPTYQGFYEVNWLGEEVAVDLVLIGKDGILQVTYMPIFAETYNS